jgi:hypothetical protein
MSVAAHETRVQSPCTHTAASVMAVRAPLVVVVATNLMVVAVRAGVLVAQVVRTVPRKVANVGGI